MSLKKIDIAAGPLEYQDDPNGMVKYFSEIVEKLCLSPPSTSTATQSVVSSSNAAYASTSYDIRASSSNAAYASTSYDIRASSSSSSMNNIATNGSGLTGSPSSSSSYNYSNGNNIQSQTNGESASSSHQSSPPHIGTCCRCDDKIPTYHCLQCNDIFCYECCHKVTSKCKLYSHALVPIQQTSVMSAQSSSAKHIEKDIVYCDLHHDSAQYYCQSCTVAICHECTQWAHKEHVYTPTTRNGVFEIFQSTKAGTKAIKNAIDRACTISNTFERDSAEASSKIRKSMRSLIQIIEDRENYLLYKVEKMRQTKIDEINDQKNTLRGILATLSHINETLTLSLNTDGVDIALAEEKARSEVDYLSNTFRSVILKEEKILFVGPNNDIVDQLRFQANVETVPFNNAPNAVVPYPPRRTYYSQPTQHIQNNSPNYNIVSTSRNPNQSNGLMNPRNNYLAIMESNKSYGIGQAIAGSYRHISIQPPRNPILGVPAFSFARDGQAKGYVCRPWGLCVDRDGNIIVADRRNNRIQIFNKRGQFMFMFGSKGNGDGQFDLPAGITTDRYTRIIVIDKDNHRVQIFSSRGKFIHKFGSFGKGNGEFQYPWDVAVNTIGNIIVSDTRNHRIQLFTADGVYINKFVIEGASPPKAGVRGAASAPRGVCFTTMGDILVSDFENHRLVLVDPTLSKVLQWFGFEGSGLGEFSRPSGMVTDDDGRLIVADSKNNRVVVLSYSLAILGYVDLKSPGLDDKDRPCDLALTPEGYLVVLFETLPDSARDVASQGKEYIKIY